MSVIPISNPIVQSYILYSAILALKLISLSALTGLTRMTRGIYANPEDAKILRGKVKFDDPTVERIRRAHLDDLENIPAFWILGALYVTTGPATAWATLLFRVYTVSRIIHTIVYAVVPLPQPARSIAYIIPNVIMWYMGIQVVLYYISALSYILYSGILALKIMAMGVLTARQRIRKKVFANEEDAMKGKGIVKLDDPDVERVRRGHLNDLENISVFWVLGALYLTTGPSSALATLLFRVYTAGRVLHTIVYVIKPLPQPTRFIAYVIPYLIKWYMGFTVVFYYLTAL
ncbi:uncharacterized protein LOC124536233 [Vanessa cardui]|uniref:uncharacterized protein LOC124536233 n=1 Tax=Vanessa cardui TaxID=171605 RepID=UPI001F144319|nr:uncharacterized protein LOC124536233 [Vanessa cardui]